MKILYPRSRPQLLGVRISTSFAGAQTSIPIRKQGAGAGAGCEAWARSPEGLGLWHSPEGQQGDRPQGTGRQLSPKSNADPRGPPIRPHVPSQAGCKHTSYQTASALTSLTQMPPVTRNPYEVPTMATRGLIWGVGVRGRTPPPAYCSHSSSLFQTAGSFPLSPITEAVSSGAEGIFGCAEKH